MEPQVATPETPETDEATEDLAPGVEHVSCSKDDREVDFELQLGTDVHDAIERFGETTVHDFFKRAAIVKAQGQARDYLKEGADKDSIRAFFQGWTPDTNRGGGVTNPAVAAKQALAQLSDEERQAILSELGIEL